MALAASGANGAAEVGDAGELPADAQEPGPAGPLPSIRGSIAGPGDRDVFKICIADPAAFSASTAGPVTPPVTRTLSDTQLFLLNAQGHGVYANDDGGFAAPYSRRSLLPAGHSAGPTTAGVYYLAISPYNVDPTRTGGTIFPDRTGTTGPSVAGTGMPMTGWTGTASPPDNYGDYEITLTGTDSCVPQDQTDPTIDLDTPPDGAVYELDQQVLADYSCADEEDGSGLASCKGSVDDGQPIDTSSLGTKTFTVTAEDEAGNTATVTHTYTVADLTDPGVSLTTPPDGAVYELGEVVNADYSCSDAGGSGLVSCEGTVPDGDPIDTSSPGEHSFTVEAEDGAGRTVSVTHKYTVVDSTDPTISIDSPADGATYGLDEQVLADFGCADAGGSGIASCEGTVADGQAIDTGTVGAHSFTVTATDKAGNTATKTVGYRVLFDFEGFFPPVENRPEVNLVTAGRTIPVKFSLDGNQGREVIADGYPRSGRMTCGSGAEVEVTEPTRSPGRQRIRYKPHRDFYVYRWKTEKSWAGTCRQFVLKLVDGSVQRADFQFRSKKHRHDEDDD
jgi:fibronectin type 3 domain-containing protein